MSNRCSFELLQVINDAIDGLADDINAVFDFVQLMISRPIRNVAERVICCIQGQDPAADIADGLSNHF